MVESKKIAAENQWDYWLGVGMLLYMMKYSHPNLAHMTRELSKANNGANHAAFKELIHVIRYVVDKKNLGLKIKPMGDSNEPWKIIYFSDSVYAGDLVSRRSISGSILYVLGISVSWQVCHFPAWRWSI